MNIPQCGIKLHNGNFSAIGKILQEQLSDGKCLRLQVKEWREKRSLSQNALSHMWYAEISEYLINSHIADVVIIAPVETHPYTWLAAGTNLIDDVFHELLNAKLISAVFNANLPFDGVGRIQTGNKV